MADEVTNAVLNITGNHQGGAVVDAIEDLLEGASRKPRKPRSERETVADPAPTAPELASAPSPAPVAAEAVPEPAPLELQQHWRKQSQGLGGADSMGSGPSQAATPDVPARTPVEEPPLFGRTDPTPPSPANALAAAHGRLQELVREATAARVRGTAEAKAQQLQLQDLEPHRREVIDAAVAPGNAPQVPEPLRPSLVALDWRIARIRNEILDNPMWRSSAFLARQTVGAERQALDFKTDKQAREEVPELREALAQLTKAEETHQRDLAVAKKAIDRLEALQRATGPIAWLRRNVFREEARLTRAAETAATREHTSEAARRGVERRARELHVAFQNVQKHEQREQREVAQARLHELERPLRDALRVRLAAEHEVQGFARVQEDRLGVGEVLRCHAVQATPGGFGTFVVLETSRHERMVLDASEHKALGRAQPGDSLRVGRNAQGGFELVGHARAPEPDRVDGVVVAITREADRISQVVVRDDASGKERTLRPKNGRDLRDDYPNARATLAKLQEGDSIAVRFQGHGIEVKARARDSGRGGR